MNEGLVQIKLFVRRFQNFVPLGDHVHCFSKEDSNLTNYKNKFQIGNARMQILFGIVFKPQIELGMYFTISNFESVMQVFRRIKKE